MFGTLGRLLARYWAVVLLGWAVLLGGVLALRPAWADVTADGEFAFLPPDSPSLAAERQFRAAFSGDLLRSSLVLVLSRPSRPGGLTGPADDPEMNDDRFLAETLLPALRDTLIAGGFAPPDLPVADLPVADLPVADLPTDPPPGGAEPPGGNPDRTTASGDPYPVAAVMTPRDRVVGPLFESADGRAALVVLGLRTEFGEVGNGPLVGAVEGLVDRLRRGGAVPAGLELAVSGTAVVGRDMRDAAHRSGDATHLASLVLVVGLLLAIYRAPLLAAVPLLTVVAGVEVALGLLGIAADHGWFAPFMGLEVYVTVVAYGAGVDYCMFLTARYREELDAAPAGSLAAGAGGADGGTRAAWGAALARAIGKVGPALAASAGTTAVGIGMMTFAEFTKYKQAGAGIVVGLVVVTLASLTLTPALLRLAGRWAFWPKIPHGRPASEGGWLAAGPLPGGGRGGKRWLRQFWAGAAGRVCAAPGRWLGGALAVMLPLAAVGVLCQDELTYGLLSELPDTAPGVKGAAAVRRHFPAGETGPVTVLLSAPARPRGPGSPASPGVNFADRTGEGRALIAELTRALWDRRGELGIAELRSLSDPLGAAADAPELPVERGGGALSAIVRRGGARVAVRSYYIADSGLAAGRMTRLDVVFEEDPFSRGSLDRLAGLEEAVRESLPPGLAGADLAVLGATASVADLAEVTDRDRLRIDVLVLLGVYAVLVVLLRRWALSAYLIATVVLGYLTTLGAVYLLFWAGALWTGNPGGFAGLDWKVPVFLFTILVAVGEDYNIYLVTRVDEERDAARGPGVGEPEAAVRGVRSAVARTGAIISGCGLIMAGTFGSLVVGELAGMVQLGVALAAGVLLDTFLIRPVLVPAYLTLLHSGRFGRLGRWLGAAAP